MTTTEKHGEQIPVLGCSAPAGAAPLCWTIGGLLRSLAQQGQHPAIVAFRESGPETWDCHAVAHRAGRMAHGLRQTGVAPGDAVALWAANSPAWIVCALAVLASGNMLVPIDDLTEADQFAAVVDFSKPRLVITTREHRTAVDASLRDRGIKVVILDPVEPAVSEERSWQSLLREPNGNMAEPAGGDPAILCWTSGTTGAPKPFVLTHRNIAVNVEALRQLAIVGPDDRALLPLPLHHIYPLVVGMLAPLSCGTTIVLPASVSGPSLLQALRDGGVSVIVGVPRLYEALSGSIATRIVAQPFAVRLLWRTLLGISILSGRYTGLGPGRILFAPVRRRVAPRLRLLVSGGARLEAGVEEQLEALGWTVLAGYGLAETASLFTGNRPAERRAGSAGRPLADGKIRIAQPGDDGIGEIELRGSSLTSGYLNNSEANDAAFTPDGWFRTGDLGYLDHEGFLFVTGRLKETLVLGGGKKVNPESLEAIYGSAPEIAEIAILEDKGSLVALVRPDPAKLYARGATNSHDAIRVILGEKAQRLPSYERLSGFALTSQPLPRTRLGKYRRFLLPDFYREALVGTSARAARPPQPDDEALLQNPSATGVWRILRQRFGGRALDLDASLSLDLNLDSFGWIELAVVLQEEAGIRFSDEDLGRIGTIRDLLRLSVERRIGVQRDAAAGERPASSSGATAATSAVERWLAPTGFFETALGAVLFFVNRLIMCGIFRLRVAGLERLPAIGPLVIAPNHVSYLDVLVIAAALGWSRLRQTYWAGDAQRFFPHCLGRLVARAVHLFPVDAMHPGAALETARRVLQAGHILVWFPEGWRSPDGRLQEFLPGIGWLLVQSGAPAVPAFIRGSFEAWPRGHRMPKLHRLAVTFGLPVSTVSLRAAGQGATDEERAGDALHRSLAALADRRAARSD